MWRVIVELWPVTLPTAIYLVWYVIQCLRKRARGEVHHPLKQGPWLRIFLISVGVAAVCALMLVFSQEATKGAYVPATLEDGRVRDGNITP